MMRVRVNIEADNILVKRKLNKDGKAQVFFTRECAKYMNLYVPFDKGILKDINVKVGIDSVTYFAPYAKKQYFTNKGNGIDGTNKGGLRGKEWDKRMWNDKGNEIIEKVCIMVGGRRV